ncbi:MAG: nitrile hydratase subunit beta [Pseudomonadota bacterium]
MTRPHDMGGRFGDGPVLSEPETPTFTEEWHARALAVTLAVGALGQWNIDTSRHARERLSPKDYARFSYYEKWMAALADLMAEKRVVTKDELLGEGVEPSALSERRLTVDRVAQVLASGAPADRPGDFPQAFAPGDAVLARHFAENIDFPGGHTRLPAYAAGARGRILICHGAHVLPDAAAHGKDDTAEPLYTVAFKASELWAHPEHPDDEVMLDLWQSYLSPVP